MLMRRIWSGLALITVLAVPAVVVSQEAANAATPKADWRSNKASSSKARPKVKKTAAPANAVSQVPEAPATEAPTPEAPINGQSNPPTDATAQTPAIEVPLRQAGSTEAIAVAQDQSQEVLEIDLAVAASILSQGPKEGYGNALSDVGVLYDANGASPAGQEAANTRFGTFPSDVKLVRTPESALAAGGSGSSWGTYTIKRGDMILSGGRYISVWRRETTGWKMISELAAGKTVVPPQGQGAQPIGVLPKRPVSLGRAAPSPVGVPLTVPTPPASASGDASAPTLPPTP